MFLSFDGITDAFLQYECKNISQVKNTINKLTNIVSVNSDWKYICDTIKKEGGSDSIDYICIIDNIEKDCIVNIGYDKNSKSYLVWIVC